MTFQEGLESVGCKVLHVRVSYNNKPELWKLRQENIAGFDDFFVHNSQFLTLFIAILWARWRWEISEGSQRMGTGRFCKKSRFLSL
jgi:hypothetical protein